MPLPIAASSIVAQAFRYMETSPISSLSDDSEKAQAAAEQFPQAMRMCLSFVDWSFASVVAHLPRAVTPASFAIDPDMPFAYELPGDLIRLHDVGDAWTAWRADRDYLRADHEAPLPIRYTADMTEDGRLPPAFREAVALRLACLLGPRWLTTQSKLQDLENRAQTALRQAAREDARTASGQRYDDLSGQSDWVAEARR